MDSLTDLREEVDVLIGVDTHVHTHSAAVLDTATGGVQDEVTVEATADGYAELVEFANHEATLRAWAIEGTSGHGAGLSRHLLNGLRTQSGVPDADAGLTVYPDPTATTTRGTSPTQAAAPSTYGTGCSRTTAVTTTPRCSPGSGRPRGHRPGCGCGPVLRTQKATDATQSRR